MTDETRPVGRPTLMTQDVLNKLDSAFSIGASDKEACLIADISTQTLYNYQHENPEYEERKELLKDMPKYQARKNIVKALYDENVNVSQWYAERKGKDEFSQRTEQTGKDGKDLGIVVTPEALELAQQLNELDKQHKRNRAKAEAGANGVDTKPVGTETSN